MSTALQDPYPVREVGGKLVLFALFGLVLSTIFGILVTGI